MMATGDGLPVLERIRRTLIALRMPRALELLDHAVHQLERGETSALELIDALLAEELSVRETSRIKTALRMGRLAMGASDLIKALQNTLRGGGRPHMGLGHHEHCRFIRYQLLVRVSKMVFSNGCGVFSAAIRIFSW
jgi:hypothetical protein